MGDGASKTKKQRKFDRNKLTCARYAAEGRREKSHAKRLADHLTKSPWDGVARKAFEALSLTITKNYDVPKYGKSPVVLRREQGTTLTAEKKAVFAG